MFNIDNYPITILLNYYLIIWKLTWCEVGKMIKKFTYISNSKKTFVK